MHGQKSTSPREAASWLATYFLHDVEIREGERYQRSEAEVDAEVEVEPVCHSQGVASNKAAFSTPDDPFYPLHFQRGSLDFGRYRHLSPMVQPVPPGGEPWFQATVTAKPIREPMVDVIGRLR